MRWERVVRIEATWVFGTKFCRPLFWLQFLLKIVIGGLQQWRGMIWLMSQQDHYDCWIDECGKGGNKESNEKAIAITCAGDNSGMDWRDCRRGNEDSLWMSLKVRTNRICWCAKYKAEGVEEGLRVLSRAARRIELLLTEIQKTARETGLEGKKKEFGLGHVKLEMYITHPLKDFEWIVVFISMKSWEKIWR